MKLITEGHVDIPTTDLVSNNWLQLIDIMALKDVDKLFFSFTGLFINMNINDGTPLGVDRTGYNVRVIIDNGDPMEELGRTFTYNYNIKDSIAGFNDVLNLDGIMPHPWKSGTHLKVEIQNTANLENTGTNIQGRIFYNIYKIKE